MRGKKTAWRRICALVLALCIVPTMVFAQAVPEAGEMEGEYGTGYSGSAARRADGEGLPLVIVKLQDVEVVYNGMTHVAQIVAEGLPEGYTCVDAGLYNNREFATNVETITYTPKAHNITIYDGNRNNVTSQFRIETAEGTLRILPRPITVSAMSETVTYNGEEQEVTGGEVIEGAILEGHDFYVETTGGKGTEVGTYPHTIERMWVFAGMTDVSINYVVKIEDGALVIKGRQAVLVFDPNGGELVGESPVTVDADTTIDPTVFPGAVREGYELAGWFEDPQGETLWDLDNGIMPAEGLTLYAGWEAVSVSVTFDANGGEFDDGGTFTQVAREVVWGGKVTPPSAPVYQGHTFQGWSLSPDGGLYDFENAGGIRESGLVFYAIWQRDASPEPTPEKYTVRFIDSLDSRVIEKAAVEEGGNVARPANPIHLGYSFTGWYGDDSLGSAFDFGRPITADTDVFAGWAEVGGEEEKPGGNEGGNSGGNEGGNSGGSDSGGSDKPDDLDGNNGGGTTPGGNAGSGGSSGGGGRTVNVGRDVYINDLDVPLANTLLTIFDEEVPLAETSLFDIPDTGVALRGVAWLAAAAAVVIGGLAYKKED